MPSMIVNNNVSYWKDDVPVYDKMLETYTHYTRTKLYFEWSYSFLYHQLPFSTNLRLKRIGMCLQ